MNPKSSSLEPEVREQVGWSRGLLAMQERSARGPRWISEWYAFKVGVPDGEQGCCGGLQPVYRAYNNGFIRLSPPLPVLHGRQHAAPACLCDSLVGEGAGIFTTDSSCTTPLISTSGASPTLFRNGAYSFDTALGG